MPYLGYTRQVPQAVINRLKEQFPAGTRVRLIRMDDEFETIPPGTLGTVASVDDIGTIHVNWDTGSSLGVVYGVDKIAKVGVQP